MQRVDDRGGGSIWSPRCAPLKKCSAHREVFPDPDIGVLDALNTTLREHGFLELEAEIRRPPA